MELSCASYVGRPALVSLGSQHESSGHEELQELFEQGND